MKESNFKADEIIELKSFLEENNWDYDNIENDSERFSKMLEDLFELGSKFGTSYRLYKDNVMHIISAMDIAKTTYNKKEELKSKILGEIAKKVLQ